MRNYNANGFVSLKRNMNTKEHLMFSIALDEIKKENANNTGLVKMPK